MPLPALLHEAEHVVRACGPGTRRRLRPRHARGRAQSGSASGCPRARGAPFWRGAAGSAGGRSSADSCSRKPNTRGTYVSVDRGGRSDGYVISSRCGNVVPKNTPSTLPCARPPRVWRGSWGAPERAATRVRALERRRRGRTPGGCLDAGQAGPERRMLPRNRTRGLEPSARARARRGRRAWYFERG